MTAFGFSIRCGTTCNAITDIIWGGYYAGTADFTLTGSVFDTSSGTSYQTSITPTSTTTADSITYTIANIAKADLAGTYGMPNKDTQGYYKCYLDFDRGSTANGLRYSNVATEFAEATGDAYIGAAASTTTTGGTSGTTTNSTATGAGLVAASAVTAAVILF